MLTSLLNIFTKKGQENPVATEAMVFQSRFGYHPCDYATFLKLRRLNFFAQMSKRLNARHWRWQRKDPKNRFIKERVRDAQRTIVRWKIVDGNRVPWIEPISMSGNYAVKLIEENHRRARIPSKKAEDVKPLMLSGLNIDKELEIIEKWYEANKCAVK